MFKPDLSDVQRDLVVQSVTQSTLVELVTSSIEAKDLAGLLAIERNNGFHSTRLTLEHIHRMMGASVGERGALYLSSPSIDGMAVPMLDALGQIFKMRRCLANDMETHQLDFDIDPGISSFLSERLNENFDRTALDIANGYLPEPRLNGAGLTVRKHLGILAALALAVDDVDLIGKIKQIDPKALLIPLDGDDLQLQGAFMTKTITPWGLGFVSNRIEALQSHMDSGDIHETCATKVDDEGYILEFEMSDLINLEEPSYPVNPSISMWAIKQIAKESQRPGVNDRASPLIRLICYASDNGSLEFAKQVLDQVPEIFRQNLQSVIETCCEQMNLDLLVPMMRKIIDWTIWDDQMELDSVTAMQAKQPVTLPYGHPLGIVIDVLTSHGDCMAHDILLSTTLRVMLDAGKSDLLLRTDVNFDIPNAIQPADQQYQPLSFEVAQMGLTKTLEVLLSAGLDPLQTFKGVTLIDSCEASKASTCLGSLSMLRAVLGQREANAAMESVLHLCATTPDHLSKTHGNQ